MLLNTMSFSPAVPTWSLWKSSLPTTHIVQQFESVIGRRLIVLVVADQPRQKSDDSTSVGRKCLRANVLFPDPLGPMRTTRESLGIVISIFISNRLAAVASVLVRVGR